MSALVRSSPRDGLMTTTVPPAASTPSNAATWAGSLRSMIPTRRRGRTTAAIRRAERRDLPQVNHSPSYSIAGAAGSQVENVGDALG